MAIGVMNWVWDHSKSRHGARLVLLAIADCGETAWPSVAELVRKTGLKERAVQSAITDLAKLGELEVQYNQGPKGCNRYRVLMTPAKSAPPQNLHPAEDAPPQDLRGSASPQVSAPTPAKSAPPADIAPPQISTPAPAESAPGTVIEPELKNSLSESSSGRNDDAALFDAGKSPATGKRRGRRTKPRASGDSRFDEFYAVFPVHKAPGDAEQAYAKAVREGADPEALLAAAKLYRDDPQVLRGYGKYPATWLNKKCWLDEPTPPQQSGSHDYSRGGAADPLTDQAYGPGSTRI